MIVSSPWSRSSSVISILMSGSMPNSVCCMSASNDGQAEKRTAAHAGAAQIFDFCGVAIPFCVDQRRAGSHADHDGLVEAGITVEDTPGGARWSLKKEH